MTDKKSIRHAGLLIVGLLLFCNTAITQTLADTIRNEMVAINHQYDSAFYLTFDVDITYERDTTGAVPDSLFNRTAMQGTYTFHQNKALYKLGEIEYMQNDSFTIAAYKESKIMLVGKRAPGQSPGRLVPTRDMVDTMMTQLEQDFILSYADFDSVKVIELKNHDTNSSAIYKLIRIEFDPVTYYLVSVQYLFLDTGAGESEGTEPSEAYLATLTFSFTNYRVEQVGPSVFDESRFLFFNGPNDPQPAPAYSDYTLYKNY